MNHRSRSLSSLVVCAWMIGLAAAPRSGAQSAALPQGALGIPQTGPTTDAPYAPQPILPGGIVVPLYPPDSPQLNADRARKFPRQFPWN